MRGVAKIGIGLAGVLAAGLLGYTGYVGLEGARQGVTPDGSDDCRTPDIQYGWDYEAINYDQADDARLRAANPGMDSCADRGSAAGDEIVTDDGIRIAGWYIPAGDGSPATAPTVVLVHGHGANKSGILHYAIGLHESFNLVAFDERNSGRSTGEKTTIGVLEQKDLRAVIDWLERTKHPVSIGVLGNSQGAIAAINEATGDPRVQALVLDSMHTRMRYQFERRLELAGHPAYPGTWAIFLATWLQTGVWFGSADAIDALPHLGTRPILLIHGEGDQQDLPERTQAFYDQAIAGGMPAELRWCPTAGHDSGVGMPAEVCADDFGTWTRDFFARTLRTAPEAAVPVAVTAG